MKNTWQGPSEIRIVSDERIPDNLFVCLAKIKPEAGTALKSAFDTGAVLPKDLEAIYNRSLIYEYTLAEKDIYWEAGPSADFTEVLYIFSTDSLEEAQTLMHNDPLYKQGMFYNDWWFPYEIHGPLWKASPAVQAMIENDLRSVGILPLYPPGVEPQIIELKVTQSTPLKLFACTARIRLEKKLELGIGPGLGDAKARPAITIHHLYNKAGPGGSALQGDLWEDGSGTDADSVAWELGVFSVNSIETAQFLMENESFAKWDLTWDFNYFEWCIHMPLRKASPTHKEALKGFLLSAGVELS